MDKQGFRQFLQERKIPAEQIEQHLAIAERFEAFAGAARHQPPTAEDVRAFSALLIAEKLNTLQSYYALIRYGRFTTNKPVIIAAIELIDGAEAMENLRLKLGQQAGEQKRDEVFQGIELPPLGTPLAHLPRVTHAVMGRLEAVVDPETCRKVLSSGLRHLEDEWYLEEKKKYEESGSIDAYLERKGQEFIAQLEQIKREGGLFFTQEITDEVIDFVRSHPEIAQGVRQGNVLYEIKIPHMTIEYLAETDEKMKRYYYCHCPWVKESLKTGELGISPTFCNCSAAFHKKTWDVIFGRPLEAEIVESVLKGDPWCKIAIHLPL